MSTIYVRQSDGSDRDSGLSQTDAFRTIQKALALAKATPGPDKIHIDDGVYAPQVVKADYTTLLFSDGAKISGALNPKAMHGILVAADHVTVEGPEIFGVRGAGFAAADGSDWITLRGAYSHDNGGHGASFIGGDYYVIEDNTFAYNVGRMDRELRHVSGVSILHPREIDGGGAYHIKMLGNVIYGTGTPAKSDGFGAILDTFKLADSPFVYDAATLIAGNTFRENGNSGLYAYHVENVTVRGNAFWHNAQDDTKQLATEIGLNDAHGVKIIGNAATADDGEFVFYASKGSDATFSGNDFGPADDVFAPWSAPIAASTAAFAINPHEAFPWWDEGVHILNFG